MLMGLGPSILPSILSDVPATIPDLQLWLRSDIGVVQSGGVVTQWKDISGNERHATQSNASQRPTYAATVINNLPGIVFDGVDDFLTGVMPVAPYRNSPTTSSNQEWVIFAVTKMDVLQDGMIAETSDSSGLSQVGFYMNQVGNNRIFTNADGSVAGFKNFTDITNGTFNIGYKEAISRYINSNIDHSFTGTSSQSGTANTQANYRIGLNFANTTPFAGKILEIGMYNRANTNSLQFERLTAYLSNRYSL
jgi:hypothetical protein